MSYYSFIHHGGVEGVTGSCHELVIGGSDSVLVDCGLFQGADAGNGAPLGTIGHQIDFDVSRVRALVVTHCHIDHIGRVPHLMAAGFGGPIICSKPTALLLPAMLEDALRIGFTSDERLIRRFLGILRERTVGIGYGTWHPVTLSGRGCSLSVCLQPAGHILGSAWVQCRVKVGKFRSDILFSGDLGAPHSPLLPCPKIPYGADVLVLESTYGDRRHEGRPERRKRLRQIIEHCFADGGVILIPAFSIGRTQELLYELECITHRFGSERLTERRRWSDLEVVVDSPLAASFTGIYRKLKQYWDAEAKQRVAAGRHPLAFEQMTVIDDHATHLRMVDGLCRTPRPGIVIAGSGMCNGGRIVNYLKALLGDSRTDVLFTGYQAQGTPGRDIQRYGPHNGYVFLDGQRYDIAAGVHTLTGYSAHADQQNLVDFVRRMRRQPGEIRLVHGEEKARMTLKDVMEQDFTEAIIRAEY